MDQRPPYTFTYISLHAVLSRSRTCYDKLETIFRSTFVDYQTKLLCLETSEIKNNLEHLS